MKLFRSIKQIYLSNLFYWILSGLALSFLGSFWFDSLFNLFFDAVILFVGIVLLDALLLFRFKDGITAARVLPKKLSNSDENIIQIKVKNKYPFNIVIELIDELPFQFQKRDFLIKGKLNSSKNHTFYYQVRPVERGVYQFNNLNIYVKTRIGLVKKRYGFNKGAQVPVYPSFIQMRQYEFYAFKNKLAQFGIKKTRRIGHSLEFEQIKNYVSGDDFRTINWKATAKRADLMVNQYQDEKSQPIYALIDTGRLMKMPFNNLKLLDYAINSSLAFANIALLKKDKAGLLCFSNKIQVSLKANHKANQLQRINEALYAFKTDFKDADYGLLYGFIKREITQRSLLILYTNFEHITALKRQLPYLKALSKKHLLLVVFFINTEFDDLLKQKAEDIQSIYYQTIAQKMDLEKTQMQIELKRSGIFSILTKPQHLSVSVINKYLNFKSRGLI